MFWNGTIYHDLPMLESGTKRKYEYVVFLFSLFDMSTYCFMYRFSCSGGKATKNTFKGFHLRQMGWNMWIPCWTDGRHSGRDVAGSPCIHQSSWCVLSVYAIGISMLLLAFSQPEDGSEICYGTFLSEYRARPTLWEGFGRSPQHTPFIPMCFVHGCHKYVNSFPSLPTTWEWFRDLVWYISEWI